MTIRFILLMAIAVYSIYLLYDSIKKRNRVDFVMAIILLTLLFLTQFVSIVYVSGPSMQPNFYTDDFILVLKTHKVQRYDVAIINYEDIYLVKRIIGLPGDKLSLSNGNTYINGEKINEAFEYHSGNKSIAEMHIPNEHIFIIGDNRANSKDSRVFGPVPTADIYGKMIKKLTFISKIPLLPQLLKKIAIIQAG